ncbi:MAG: YicC family protein [Bacteroidales bacterium]|nr:YicC family protein [Bacteroidales bacterium]
MIQSMTGFGKAIVELPTKKITIEIKSLNSKQMDLSARIPSYLREKEMDIRSMLGQQLERGKIDLSIFVENTGAIAPTTLNQPVILAYKQQIETLSGTLGVETPPDWFSVLLRLPDAVKTEIAELGDEEWNDIKKGIGEAIDHLQAFRKQEGKMLESFLTKRIAAIGELLEQVAQYETERIDKIKGRIEEALAAVSQTDYDKNRFEQEMIYYIEKLDINEEKSRLKNHLHYFLETLQKGNGQGKKLGFITQEIGREINTLGSKSNHVELQKIVVLMKDNLEQIKEQILNVL